MVQAYFYLALGRIGPQPIVTLPIPGWLIEVYASGSGILQPGETGIIVAHRFAYIVPIPTGVLITLVASTCFALVIAVVLAGKSLFANRPLKV